MRTIAEFLLGLLWWSVVTVLTTIIVVGLILAILGVQA